MQAIPDLGKRWDGETVVIFGSGPSLTQEDIEAAKSLEARYIVTNDTYKLVDFADVLYGCDYKWWNHHFEEIMFAGEMWTQDIRARREFGLNWVLGKAKAGLGKDCVHFGSHSGYQAINLAYLWGAKRIILLGYDCRNIDGKAHWFGQHPKGLNQQQGFSIWLNHYTQLAKDLEEEGIEVINATPESAITAFTKRRIHEGL